MVLKPDYTVGDTLVFQYILQHKAGKYEFVNYSLFTNLGYIQSTQTERAGFSIPFIIREGEISYLGDIVVNTREFKQTGRLIKWLDNSSRELNKFKNKFPKIDWSTFSNRTIKKGDIENHQLIQFINDAK